VQLSLMDLLDIFAELSPPFGCRKNIVHYTYYYVEAMSAVAGVIVSVKRIAKNFIVQHFIFESP
jgi:hypothetical protein